MFFLVTFLGEIGEKVEIEMENEKVEGVEIKEEEIGEVVDFLVII